MLMYAPNTTATDTSKPVRSQDCSNTGWNTAPLTGGDTVMGYLEPLLSCSSWCNVSSSPLEIYRFSNVNNGIPTSYCYDAVQNNVRAYSRTGYIVGFTMTGITLLAFLFGLWLRSDINSEGDHNGGVKPGDGPSQMRMNY